MSKRTITHILKGSGMEIVFSMPDLYQLVLSNVKAPNPMTSRIMELLEGYGLVGATTAAQRTAYAQETYLAAVELASLCLVNPKLVLDREPDESAGEVGPSAFAHGDWAEMGRLFRANPTANTNSEP
jgi:hypothetical protein